MMLIHLVEIFLLSHFSLLLVFFVCVCAKCFLYFHSFNEVYVSIAYTFLLQFHFNESAYSIQKFLMSRQSGKSESNELTQLFSE